MRYLLLLCCIYSAYAAAGNPPEPAKLQRLFFTPQQRIKLNQLRTEPHSKQPAPATMTISIQGYIQRDDGKSATVWLNHQALQENTRHLGLRIRKIEAEGVSIETDTRHVILQAGKTYTFSPQDRP